MRNFYSSILLLCAMFVLSIDTQAQNSNYDAYATQNVDTVWFEDFEAGVLPQGWDTINSNDKINTSGFPCYFKVTDKHPTGTYPIGNYHAGLWYDYSHQDEWLITKSFECPAGAVFNFTSISIEQSTHEDHFYVKVSTDDGETWTTLWDALDLPNYAQNNYDWYYHIDLSNYEGQEIRLAFNATDAGNGLYHPVFVDNVSVTIGIPSSIEETSVFETNIYPNPAQTFVKIASQQEIEQVNILKVNGQQVQSLKAVNSTEMRVDTENFVEGLYIVEVIKSNGKTEKHKLMIAR